MGVKQRFPQYFLIGTILTVLVLLQFSSYYLSERLSRIVILSSFIALMITSTYANIIIQDDKNPYNRYMLFLTYLAASFLFYMRRNFLMDFSSFFYTRTYSLVYKYSLAKYLVFDSIRAFLFQTPLMMYFIEVITGLQPTEISYISSFFRIILIAANATLLNFFLRRKKLEKSYNIKQIMPNLVSILVISFSYSERGEFALILMFTLMYLLSTDWYYDLKKNVILLILVIGITFGSSTASLILIPFFFIFGFLKRNFTSSVYGLIPLTYIVYIGGPYTEALGFYSRFAWQGLSQFITSLLLGSFSERVLPWNRVSSTTILDTYFSTISYFSLLLLASLIILIGIVTWTKEGGIFKENISKVFFRVNIVTLILIFGAFILVYIGASVQTETSFSDIRTIIIVIMTLLIPYLLASDEIQKIMSRRSLLFAAIALLIILSSMRTYYETYPKGLKDPINVLEDRRLDIKEIDHTRNFINTYFRSVNIGYDFKTNLIIPHYLFSDDVTSQLIVNDIPDVAFIVYDIRGIEYPSLHTSNVFYITARAQTDQTSVIYNNGSILIQETS